MKKFAKNLESKILITGSGGLVGSHLMNLINDYGFKNILNPRSSELNLLDINSTIEYFKKNKPEYVINMAGKVGGILSNKNFPGDYYFENSLINTHMYDVCAKHGVKRLISLGAGCGYPLTSKEPLREESIFDGIPQGESWAYSSVKKMLIVQAEAYKKQYDLSSAVLIPSNIYGEYDNFDLDDSHVIPALVRKFYEASIGKYPSVKVWGNGEAARDFVHAKDVANASIHYLFNTDYCGSVNIAFGKQYKIKEVLDMLNNIVPEPLEIEYQVNMPSGQLSREFFVEKSKDLIPEYSVDIDLQKGLELTLSWLNDNYDNESTRL